MNFKNAAKLGALLAKDYAEDLFGLLVNYRDISASEAASRLNLHIRTVQDFLEAMTDLRILTRVEVYEKKRPYFRYSLKTKHISLDLDLTVLDKKLKPQDKPSKKIKERKNSGAKFTTARYDQYFSAVVIWTGKGRDQKERKISLTTTQGKFLYHLPFPSAPALSITEIMNLAGIEDIHTAEILDIVEALENYGVIEAIP